MAKDDETDQSPFIKEKILEYLKDLYTDDTKSEWNPAKKQKVVVNVHSKDELHELFMIETNTVVGLAWFNA